VSAHSGTVTVDSVPGRTAFTVSLPVSQPQAGPAAADARPQEVPATEAAQPQVKPSAADSQPLPRLSTRS
jgi:hypothetical protein